VWYPPVMVIESMTAYREQELLERVRSRRGLPSPAERRRIREQAGVSLRELGMAIGVSHVAITRWEAGAQPASAAHAKAYGRLLEELKRS
jgi:DNA-binding transcriptional regulator YiaG